MWFWHSPLAVNTSTEKPVTEKLFLKNLYPKNLCLKNLCLKNLSLKNRCYFGTRLWLLTRQLKNCFWKTCILKTCFWKTCIEKPVSEKPASEKPVSEKSVLFWHSPLAFNTSTEKPVTEKLFLKNLYPSSPTAASNAKVSNNSARIRSIIIFNFQRLSRKIILGTAHGTG